MMTLDSCQRSSALRLNRLPMRRQLPAPCMQCSQRHRGQTRRRGAAVGRQGLSAPAGPVARWTTIERHASTGRHVARQQEHNQPSRAPCQRHNLTARHQRSPPLRSRRGHRRSRHSRRRSRRRVAARHTDSLRLWSELPHLRSRRGHRRSATRHMNNRPPRTTARRQGLLALRHRSGHSRRSGRRYLSGHRRRDRLCQPGGHHRGAHRPRTNRPSSGRHRRSPMIATQPMFCWTICTTTSTRTMFHWTTLIVTMIRM